MRTLVCGFLRCGATPVLKMLEAAGIPILIGDGIADAERYQHSGVRHFRTGAGSWPPDSEDKAVKILEPHLYIPPMGPKYRAIWIDRDPTQQAKSQVAFARECGQRLQCPFEQLVKGIIRDRAAASKVLNLLVNWSDPNCTVLEMRFEDLIEHPLEMAEDICAWLRQGDPKKVAAVIHKRKADFSGMRIVKLSPSKPIIKHEIDFEKLEGYRPLIAGETST